MSVSRDRVGLGAVLAAIGLAFAWAVRGHSLGLAALGVLTAVFGVAIPFIEPQEEE